MSTMKLSMIEENANELVDVYQLQNRHVLASSSCMTILIRMCGKLLKAIRNFMESKDFIEVTARTITNLTSTCEDFSTLFSLDYFGNKAFLTQTAQLHLEPLDDGKGSI